MSLFLSGLIIFALLGLLLFLPSARRIDWHKNYRQQQNVELYQQQMSYRPAPELAAELSAQLLNDEKQLKNQPHFIALQPTDNDPRKSTTYYSVKTAIGLFVLLLALPIGYYFSLSRFDYVQQGQQEFNAAQQKRESASVTEKNEDYIIEVQNKLRQDPNNGDNWVELGQAYMMNNDFDNALKAYSNAAGLIGSKPHLLGLAATALYYDAGQRITPKVKQLIETALQQDPQETSSLSLLASDAFLTTEYQQAIELWQQLLDSSHGNIDRRSIIQSMQMAEQLHKAQQQ